VSFWIRGPRVVGVDRAGEWHIARVIYPASMDTVCGKTNEPATNFYTEGHPDLYPARPCQACLATGKGDSPAR